MTHYRDDKVVGDWVKGYYAIPLLPVVNIREGWEYVGTFIPGVKAALPANLRHKPELIHKYYKKFWLRSVGPDRLSVHGQYTRTNNSAESWHSRINKGVGTKPKFWDYCEKIVEECRCFVDNVRRYEGGVRITRPRPTTTTQVLIDNATRKFQQDGDVALFIRRCRHLAGKKAKSLVDPEGYEPASQPDNPPTPPPLPPADVPPPLLLLPARPPSLLEVHAHGSLCPSRPHSQLLAPSGQPAETSESQHHTRQEPRVLRGGSRRWRRRQRRWRMAQEHQRRMSAMSVLLPNSTSGALSSLSPVAMPRLVRTVWTTSRG